LVGTARWRSESDAVEISPNESGWMGTRGGGPGGAEIAVYDVNGRLIRRLASGPREAGEHRLSWDGRDEAGRSVASGVYLAQAEAEGLRLTAKVLKME